MDKNIGMVGNSGPSITSAAPGNNSDSLLLESAALVQTDLVTGTSDKFSIDNKGRLTIASEQRHHLIAGQLVRLLEVDCLGIPSMAVLSDEVLRSFIKGRYPNPIAQEAVFTKVFNSKLDSQHRIKLGETCVALLGVGYDGNPLPTREVFFAGVGDRIQIMNYHFRSDFEQFRENLTKQAS